MKPISFEVVEKTFEEMSNLKPEEMRMLVDKMSVEQPYVLTYLLATGDREFDEFEKEIFLFLGIGIWQTISKIHRPLPLVLPILLDEIEEDNLNLLDSLKNLSEKKFIDRIGQIIDSYPQPAILFYIVDTLIEDVETEISSEKLGLMFIHLKIVIESFQKAIAFKKENFQTK